MLKLFIRPEEKFIESVDGRILSVYPVFFPKEGRMYKFSDYSFPRIKKIKLIVDFSFMRWKIKINKEIEKGIVNAIGLYHRKKKLSFDCYAFVNSTFGIKPHNVLYMKKFWDTKPKRFISKVGDVIFLVNKTDDFFYHAAIHIGFGLYISIYGAGGDLEVSSLKSMMYDFGAERVMIAKPK